VDGDKEPLPLRAVATACGYQLAVNFSPIVELVKAARDAKNIVELGSGPGWNLFELALFIGRASADKRFFALEYTDAGLEISSILASHPESPPLTSHHFNYLDPDISMVPDDGPTLFFSQHSVEQVPDISPKLYKDMISRKSPLTLIHMEPIGWQREPSIAKARMKGDDAFFQALIIRRHEASGEAAVLANSAINSWRQGYNRNAYSLLMKHVSSKHFTLEEAVFDFTWDRNTNIVNPTTFLKFTAKQRSSLWRKLSGKSAAPGT
jgi:hypothetical protein